MEHVSLRDIKPCQASFVRTLDDEVMTLSGDSFRKWERPYFQDWLVNNSRDGFIPAPKKSPRRPMMVPQSEWDCMKAEISAAHQQQAETLVILYQLQSTSLYYQYLLEQAERDVKSQELLVAITKVLLPTIGFAQLPKPVLTATTDHAWTVIFNGKYVFLNYWFKHFVARISAALRDYWPLGKRRLTCYLGIGRHVTWAFQQKTIPRLS
jgi:hypothetical protein